MKKIVMGSSMFLALLFFLATGCSHLNYDRSRESEALRSKESPLNITLTDSSSSPPLFHEVNTYTAVHALYSGLLLPLELTETLSLPEKRRLFAGILRQGPNAQLSTEIEISGYFHTGELYLWPIYHQGPPRRLQWISNAVYSPIDHAALRERGALMPKDSALKNISDIIFLKDGYAVRISQIFSTQAESYYRSKRLHLNLADLYLHDGIPENDDRIPQLLRTSEDEYGDAPLEFLARRLTEVQFFLYEGMYQAAREELVRLYRDYGEEFAPAAKALHRFTYEEYALCSSLDQQSGENLVEYRDFLRENAKGENSE